MRAETNLPYWVLKCSNAFVCVHLGAGRKDKQASLATAQIIKFSSGCVLPNPQKSAQVMFKRPSGPSQRPNHLGTQLAWPFTKSRLPRWPPPLAKARQRGRGPGRAAVRSLAPWAAPLTPPRGSRGRTRPGAAVQTGECASPASSLPRCGRPTDTLLQGPPSPR